MAAWQVVASDEQGEELGRDFATGARDGALVAQEWLGLWVGQQRIARVVVFDKSGSPDQIYELRNANSLRGI